MPSESPELVLHNVNIVTLDPGWPQAQSMAVKGERIRALGDDKAILAMAGPNTTMK